MSEDRPDSDPPAQPLHSPSDPDARMDPQAPGAPSPAAPEAPAASDPASAEAPTSDGAEPGPAAPGAPTSDGAEPGPAPAEAATPDGAEPGRAPAEAATSDGAEPGPAAPAAQGKAGSGGQQPRRGTATPRSKRPREPLPWPELRATAALVADGGEVEHLKDLFRLLPPDVREETVEGVREYRKGARRPVSAFAGKSLARAVHTARRGRRRPESDRVVAEALGQALAAEVVASLDVELAAAVILPKRDLLEREAKDARRRQRYDDERARDERRRAAREESVSGGTFGGDEFTGPKIRGLEQLEGLFGDEASKSS